MKKRKPLTDEEGEVRHLTTEDFKQFRPSDEVMTTTLREKLSTRKRGLQRAPTKERITIRLSQEVVDQFRTTGEGWQARVDSALKDWLETHSAVRK